MKMGRIEEGLLNNDISAELGNKSKVFRISEKCSSEILVI